MQLLLVVVTILGLLSPVVPSTNVYTVSYNTTFDQGHTSLDDVTCSNGEHGLKTSGYTTFDSLPTFPYIGGAPQIASWNSRYCGSCWELTYIDAQGNPQTLNITAVATGDGSADGFTISLEAMNHLTDGHAKSLGKVPITAVKIPERACGLEKKSHRQANIFICK